MLNVLLIQSGCKGKIITQIYVYREFINVDHSEFLGYASGTPWISKATLPPKFFESKNSHYQHTHRLKTTSCQRTKLTPTPTKVQRRLQSAADSSLPSLFNTNPAPCVLHSIISSHNTIAHNLHRHPTTKLYPIRKTQKKIKVHLWTTSFNLRMLRALPTQTCQVGTWLTHSLTQPSKWVLQQQEPLLTSKNLSYKTIIDQACKLIYPVQD